MIEYWFNMKKMVGWLTTQFARN